MHKQVLKQTYANVIMTLKTIIIIINETRLRKVENNLLLPFHSLCKTIFNIKIHQNESFPVD